MARVKQLDRITGNIGKLSFYTRKGSDEIFVRTKGGATKEQIKRRPEFANVRKNNKEFGGCSKMSKAIRDSFAGLQHVADYNLAPVLCSLMKKIQVADTEGIWGERGIFLSKHKLYLSGFNFNRVNRFDSVLRIPLEWKIDRDKGTATLTIPEFSCSPGLHIYGKHRLFRISATLGVVADMVLNERKSDYMPLHDTMWLVRSLESTAWFPTTGTVPGQTIDLKMTLYPDVSYIDHSDTFVLSVAVEFGAYDDFGQITAVKDAGAGKVLGVG